MFTFLEFLKALSEMPMANYRYSSVPDDPEAQAGVKDFGGYDDVDKQVLQKDSTSKKLEEVLARSTGHNFNILMLEYPSFLRKADRMTVPTKKLYKPYVEKYCQENNIPIQGHITFAKNKSTGDPMKPWMILHTIGHALTEEYPRTQSEMGVILKDVAMRHATSHGYGYSVRDDKLTQMEVMARIFKFGSAQRIIDQKTRKTQIRDFGELVHELFAEFLWHGKIRYQMPEEDLRKPRGENDFKSNIHLAPWKGGDVAEDIKHLEYYIKDLLDESVGKILIDFN